MGKDERYAIYVYYGVAGAKIKPAPLRWYDPAAGYLRAYLSGSDSLAERAIVLLTQSAAGYLDDVVTAYDTLLYGELFDFINKDAWFLQLKQQVKAGLGKSTAIEADLPDMGGAIASRTGVLVSSADLGEMIGIKNIQHPVVATLAAKVFKEPIRWHALCFKARMPVVEPDLQEVLTGIVARVLAGF